MIRASRKGILFYYLVILIFILGILGNRSGDYISKEYYNYPDYPELNNISVCSEYQDARNSGTVYEGMVTTGPDITLPQGSYRLDFRYRSETQGNWYEVMSDYEVNTENTQGKSYGAGELPLNEDGRLSVDFVIPEDAEHVQIKTHTTEGDLQIFGYTLESVAPVNNDAWARAIVILFAALAFHAGCIRPLRDAAGKEWYVVEDAGRLGSICAVLLIGLTASLPCLTDFVTSGHDLDYHLTRIEGLKEALSCGQFPVRINPEFSNGHGMAAPIMYPELLLYFPAVLRLCKVSLILSYKLFCIALNLLCAWAGYTGFGRLMKSRVLGVLMSAFYTLALYRMNNLYMRAAVGEWVGMVFLPIVLYGMYALFYEEKEKWGWSVLSFTLCLQGHLLITEMAVAFAVLFAVLSWKQLREKGRFLNIVKAGAVTVMLNLWYLIPLLYLYRQPLGVTAEQQPLSQYALYPDQLFTTFLYNNKLGEFLGSTAGDGPSSVGGILGIGILFYLYAAYIRKSLSKKEKRAGNLLLLFGMMSLYMTTYYFPWNLFQKIKIIDILAGILQFPLRILSMATLFLSCVCALGFYGIMKGKVSGKGIALIGVIAAIVASAYTLDAYTGQNETRLADDTDTYNKNLIYNGLLYYQGTDCNALLNRKPVAEASSEKIRITEYKKHGTTVSFRYDNQKGGDGYIEVPLYYYPGYRVWINGTQGRVEAGENGIARVYLDAGSSGEVLLQYREKTIFLIGDVLSLIGFIGCAVVAVRFHHSTSSNLI